jgi:hypothetical protein
LRYYIDRIGNEVQSMSMSDLLKKLTDDAEPFDLLPVSDQTLSESFLTAFFILRDEAKAVTAVARAVAQLPYSAAAQLDNRRERPHDKGDQKSDKSKREPYRPLTGKQELLRLLLLHELDELELEEESEGRLKTPADQVRCLIKQIVKTVLHRNSFYAAVAMGLILCDYTVQETMGIYDFVAPLRSFKKDWAAYSVAKEVLIKAILKRFPNRVQVRKYGRAYKFVAHKADPSETQHVGECLLRFLPPQPQHEIHLASAQQRIISRTADEMDHIYRLFDIVKFNEIARSLIPPLSPLEQHLFIPEFAVNPNSPVPPASTTPNVDIAQLKCAIVKERRRRRKVIPGSLSVSVDGVERATLDDQVRSCRILLEEGASLIRVLGRDENNEEIVLAAYALTYEQQRKTEYWEEHLTFVGTINCQFEYFDNDIVSAVIRLFPTRIGRQQFNPVTEVDGNIVDWRRFTTAQMLLDFACIALSSRLPATAAVSAEMQIATFLHALGEKTDAQRIARRIASARPIQLAQDLVPIIARELSLTARVVSVLRELAIAKCDLGAHNKGPPAARFFAET